MAQRELNILRRLWKHGSVPRQRKLRIFNALVLSKLVYGLATAWLGKAERSRLDGFQSRCLRAICNIPPAFISRISNAAVLRGASQRPVTAMILEQQLWMFGRIEQMPSGTSMRDCTFCPGTLRPAAERYGRRVGRPHLDWTAELLKIACEIVGQTRTVEPVLVEPDAWKVCVRNFCKLV